MAMTEAEVRQWSENLFDKIASDDPAMHKSAAQDLTDYTRISNREGSFTQRIIEPSEYDRNRLVPQMHTDQPIMLFEYEVQAPFAVPVDYSTTPEDYIPKGRRYPVVLQRMQTPAVTMELLSLETYQQDLRQILADNMTKELIALRDWKFLSACRRILGTTPGTVLPWVGKAMYQDLGAALTHSSLQRGKNVLRDTEFNIEPTVLLANNLRRTDFELFQLDEFHGTESAVSLAKNGFAESTYSGLNILFTIKRKLVPFADIFMFGPQEYLGRYVQYIPPTMSVKKLDDLIIQFFQYEIFGITIAHPGALCGLQYL